MRVHLSGNKLQVVTCVTKIKYIKGIRCQYDVHATAVSFFYVLIGNIGLSQNIMIVASFVKNSDFFVQREV